MLSKSFIHSCESPIIHLQPKTKLSLIVDWVSSKGGDKDEISET
jgi:hypothetical protein